MGETPAFLNDTFAFTMERAAKYGTVFRTHLFGNPTVVIADFLNYKKVFYGDHKLVQQQFPPSVPALLGPNSARPFLDDDFHRTMRRTLNPAFKPEALATYLPAVQEIVEGFLEDAERQGAVPLYPLVKNVTFEFASRLLLCIDLDDESRKHLPQRFTEMAAGLYSSMINLPGTTWHRARSARDYILAVLEEGTQTIAAQVRAGEQPERPSLFFQAVRMLHQDGDPLEPRSLAYQALGLFFGGHDTTAGGYSVLLAYLPQLPRVMQKLREEQQRVVAKHGTALTQAAMAEMPYATACVMEGLRLLGPVRVVFRVALKDFELNGKRIPKGTRVVVAVDAVHALDPSIATDASRASLLPPHMDRDNLEVSFVPERWLDEATKPTGIGSFGMGPHLCLGMPLYIAEAKALLAITARSYKLSLPNGRMQWERTFPQPVPTADTLLRVTRLAS
ncbi:hypothetical protein WJX72_010892 [[Myrmecia] bisecta]|uniref:Cytochrome P450 n=1 Tax=[Myrmecia] bisecta TaxID=41462 RepID=A0AAW1P9F1_9CHLO